MLRSQCSFTSGDGCVVILLVFFLFLHLRSASVLARPLPPTRKFSHLRFFVVVVIFVVVAIVVRRRLLVVDDHDDDYDDDGDVQQREQNVSTPPTPPPRINLVSLPLSLFLLPCLSLAPSIAILFLPFSISSTPTIEADIPCGRTHKQYAERVQHSLFLSVPAPATGTGIAWYPACHRVNTAPVQRITIAHLAFLRQTLSAPVLQRKMYGP